MKTQDLLIVGGAGVLLYLVMAKRANAASLPAQQARQRALQLQQQQGRYATPTQTAGVVAGAVNGILNWISGTPSSSGSVATPGINGTAVVDGMGDLWNKSLDNLGVGFGSVDVAPSIGGLDLSSLWNADDLSLGM